jgi:hypothetical protein
MFKKFGLIFHKTVIFTQKIIENSLASPYSKFFVSPTNTVLQDQFNSSRMTNLPQLATNHKRSYN